MNPDKALGGSLDTNINMASGGNPDNGHRMAFGGFHGPRTLTQIPAAIGQQTQTWLVASAQAWTSPGTQGAA